MGIFYYISLINRWITIGFIVNSLIVEETESRAHHKVHNLALYPERHSWCQATPIRQEIAHPPECDPKVIDNMVCLGACFSYSVPRAQDYEPIAPYCDKCDKTFSSWTVITLNCTRESTGDRYQLTRNVELISNCSCTNCNDSISRRRTDSAEEPEESLEDELPDTLEGNELHEHQQHHLIGGHAGIPTLHKLKSVPAEMHEFNKKVDEELMIKDNKIPSDDDHDHDSARMERQRAVLVNGDHDL